jgi:phosphoglycolate phosphatase-like HAD superfamily hydrolase
MVVAQSSFSVNYQHPIMNKSIIFDIDGTLLYARGVGREAFGVAFKAAYDIDYPDVGRICFVGATDSNVVRTMADECGVRNTPAKEEHFFLVLTREIDAALSRNKPLVYNGVPELLTELNRIGFALGIITGNIRPTAWSKLRHAGLDSCFSFGGYGDDHHQRAEITRAAISRAPASAPIFMMIGDTPLDIQAAKANSLTAVAVATGWVSAEELAEAGADLVLDDFSDTQSSIDRISALL